MSGIIATIQGGAGIVAEVDTKQITPVGWDEQVARYGRGYNYPQPTGQITVYRTGDDADIEATIFAPIRVANSLKVQNSLVDFDTLGNTNLFENTNRFTDINGLQVYGDAYVIDNYTGLAIYNVVFATRTFNDAIDQALNINFLGFNDFFIPSVNQLISIFNYGGNGTDIGFNYNPFNIGGNVNIKTSTTDANPTNSSILIRGVMGSIQTTLKTNLHNRLHFRKHF